MRSILCLLGTVSALALAEPAQAQSTITLQPGTQDKSVSTELREQTSGHGIQLVIQPRISGDEQAALDFRRFTEMEEAVLLGLRTDPRFIPPARLIEMVEAIGMVDNAGIRIGSGYDINVEHDLVVASSVGSVEITHVHDGENGLVITALVRDARGNVIDPPEGSLAVYRTGGERLCFTEEIINARSAGAASVIAPSGQASLPMSFVLLLDRSGSMSSHVDEVRQAAHAFLDALPANASCSVGAFSQNGASFSGSEGFGRERRCSSAWFSLSGLDDAGGGTNFFRPLEQTFDWLSSGARANDQRLVILLTDGQANRELEREAQVLAAKGDIRVFVMHIGGREVRFLNTVADHYLAHEGDLDASLARYFEVVSESYTSQTVLRIGQCQANGN
ncbi:hypothetical protein AVO44_17735 [Ruegeria profundi]|uniref:VWFA domain-containing protein n=2 Tax=Ruegeria profundi TaxID=1685378 RepID=A0A0X3TN99_9RHOB|nr:hypothetical protein AVO44_17735 [Ruegeria profundi]